MSLIGAFSFDWKKIYMTIGNSYIAPSKLISTLTTHCPRAEFWSNEPVRSAPYWTPHMDLPAGPTEGVSSCVASYNLPS